MYPRVERNGFTLLEAVVALAIVAAVLIGALSAAGAQLRASAGAADAVVAASLAEDLIELSALRGPDGAARLVMREESGRFEPPLDDFAWSTRAIRLPEESGLAELQVEVSWPGGMVTVATRLWLGRTTSGAGS